jgi:hypothetical protein
VPLIAERIAGFPLDHDRIRTALPIIGQQGEIVVLKERPSKPGRAAELFNALAYGLAAMALQPGGVDFLGVHFEYHFAEEHPVSTWARRERRRDAERRWLEWFAARKSEILRATAWEHAAAGDGFARALIEKAEGPQRWAPVQLGLFGGQS